MKTMNEQTSTKSGAASRKGRTPPALRLAAALSTLAAMMMVAMAVLMPAGVQATTGMPVAGSNLAILQAQTGLSLTVVSQNVILNSGATTVAVPVTLDGDSNKKVASAAFSLDYDSACLQYVSVDFNGISGDFEKVVTNNAGDLDIAIYDADSPKAQFEAPSTIATVTFTVLCQVDGSTPINFSNSPAPSLGNPGGQPIAVTPVNGAVTIDWNSAPTDITLSATTISENQPISTTVGTVDKVDADSGDTWTFTLVAGTGDTDNASFAINGTTLVAGPSFNFEVKKEYSVRVQVSDGKGGIYEKQFTITVADVNETPTSLALDNNALIEDLDNAGQVVANVTVTDPDNADSYGAPPADTFSMALSGTDAAYFDKSDMQITVRAGGLLSAEAKSSYSFDVVITDNAGSVYGNSNTYTQTVTFAVINHSEFSIRTAAASRPPLWTTMDGGTLQVPVNFQAKGNAVRSSSFQVTFDDNCLSFVGVTGLGAAGSATGGVATITGAANSDYADGDLFTLTFSADGACTTSDDLTDPIYDLQVTAAALAGASSNPLPVYRFDGQAYVIPNDARGDCNSDGAIDAADFTAIALEIFDDADSLLAGSTSVDDGYWLNAWKVYGADFKGSPRGCDASPHTEPGVSFIQVSDILCTVNVVFGDTSCTTPSTARALYTPSPANLTLSSAAGDANTVDVTLSLASSNSAAGAAFSLTYDPAQLAIDPTDANQDGIPDAIVINGPADYLKLAQVSFLNDQVDFALVDTTAPLSAIGDGVLATVRFTKIGAGEPKVTVTNLSVGDSSATTLPTVVEYAAGTAQAINRIFLPAVVR